MLLHQKQLIGGLGGSRTLPGTTLVSGTAAFNPRNRQAQPGLQKSLVWDNKTTKRGTALLSRVSSL